MWKGWLSGLVFLAIVSCQSDRTSRDFLDPAIPGVTTPPDQIATVVTKWYNSHLRQTSFLDRQGRVLETFYFGYTNEKVLNRYQHDKLSFRAHYAHSDSHERGTAYLSEERWAYPENHPVRYYWHDGMINRWFTSPEAPMKAMPFRDTTKTHLLRPNEQPTSNKSFNSWERNKLGQVVRHVQVDIDRREPIPDTITYLSQRFTYDQAGRRKLAWVDRMHLGHFYSVYAPDTTLYQYDKQGRLIGELHRFTTSLANKTEIDTTLLNPEDRRMIRDYRRAFFEGWDFSPVKPNRTDTVIYRYESFDPRKHLPLHVPKDVGY